MKTFYEVVSMYYDNGKVTAFINEIKAENKLDNYSYECGSHDTYHDYFDTLEEAKAFYYDCYYC
jgi:hypothetical protein